MKDRVTRLTVSDASAIIRVRKTSGRGDSHTHHECCALVCSQGRDEHRQPAAGGSAAGIPRPPSGAVSRRADNTRNPACRPNSVRPAPTYAVQPLHTTNWRGNIGTDSSFDLHPTLLSGKLTAMARLARTIIPGVAHHVAQRGNNRQDVLFAADDRRSFRSTL